MCARAFTRDPIAPPIGEGVNKRFRSANGADIPSPVPLRVARNEINQFPPRRDGVMLRELVTVGLIRRGFQSPVVKTLKR